ncbi:MAG TPA: family 16 glycoside hydrolase, partial [Burkholderiales bacterium]|nr:family 16 glycoside hydrolase [Burkholderiales bacterium]
NVARISVRGSQVEHWLNGVRVLSCDLEDREFRARLARSKFRDYPHFARAAEGHIVLQHHGTEAWFHNIRIEWPA